MKPDRIRKGFTVVEILVCIAIISVLSALLFTAMMDSRNKARQTNCISNMRQIVTALNLYRQDYDGADQGKTNEELGLPISIVDLPTAGYIKNKQIMFCPNRFLGNVAGRLEGKWSSSYGDYYFYKKYTDFASTYSQDKSWPVVTCEYHDIAHWAKQPTPSPLTLLAITMDGTVRQIPEKALRPLPVKYSSSKL